MWLCLHRLGHSNHHRQQGKRDHRTPLSISFSPLISGLCLLVNWVCSVQLGENEEAWRLYKQAVKGHFGNKSLKSKPKTKVFGPISLPHVPRAHF